MQWVVQPSVVAWSKELPLTREIKVQLGCIFHFFFISQHSSALNKGTHSQRRSWAYLGHQKRNAHKQPARAKAHIKNTISLSWQSTKGLMLGWIACKLCLHVAIKYNFPLSEISVLWLSWSHAGWTKVGSCAEWIILSSCHDF
jgi:hypothetical protein